VPSQEKAQSQRDVAKHEAKAEAARSEASVHEAEQTYAPRRLNLLCPRLFVDPPH